LDDNIEQHSQKSVGLAKYAVRTSAKFSHTESSQGIVMTCLRCGGIFKIALLQISLRMCQCNNLKWSVFGEDIDKSMVSPFLTHSECSYGNRN